ncbi:IS1 family transposase [Taibaiella koreensis]|uniref:IS1 family transposase n=1 Tax=Taibaiella koreensis TaxID=1268548 RepID=UPI000E59EF4D
MSENGHEKRKEEYTCSTGVAIDSFLCSYCKSNCKRYGFNKAGKQRFRCKSCKRTSLAWYNSSTLSPHFDNQIKTLVKEGCGIRSIGRILKISASTVIRRIKKISSAIEPPVIATGQTFELDELCTFIGNKRTLIWVAYVIDSATKQVAAFNIGNRSVQMLAQVTEPLLRTSPAKIFTDKLLQYKSLIPPSIHVTKKYGINHIERKNLTLRTHLKRLNRRTIYFSKSVAMLHACLMIYFFG